VSDSIIPEDFEAMPSGLAYSDSLQPYYRRVTQGEIIFGLLAEEAHCNLMGICHGGALMTLADIAAASTLSLHLPEPTGVPTINLSFDFQSAGRKGRWLETCTDHVDVKRRFGFCAGTIRDGERIVLRYSGTFYVPEHDGMWKEGVERAAAVAAFNQP
jgi:uncharacterized protein (TIGR00369 family)